MDTFIQNWAIFWATLVGPLLGVGFTLWYQGFAAGRTTRMSLFSTMMRLRNHPTNPEFVGALNIVPLYFNKKTAVLDRHKELIAVYEDAGWQANKAEINYTLNMRVREHIALLLAAMSKVVGRPIEHLDILKAYSPQAWADDQNASNEIRDMLRLLLKGQIALPVIVHAAIPPASETTSEAPLTVEEPQPVPKKVPAKKAA